MPNKEKVIHGLDCCKVGNCTAECPYFTVGDCTRLYDDAITLLNGQVLLNRQTALWVWNRPHHFRCSGCNDEVEQMTPYCPNCGRKMILSETELMKEWPEKVSGNG